MRFSGNCTRSIKQREANKIYILVYQQFAERDLEMYAKGIFEYTGHIEAAARFLSEIESSVTQLKDFPYSCSVYNSPKPLNREYRIKPCGRYNIFYTVDEVKKIILVVRIISSKMNESPK